MKKLYRSKDKMVSGVLAGIGEHFSVDPVLIRLLFAVFLICTGIFPGVFIYLIAVLMIPEAPSVPSSAPVEATPRDDSAKV